MTIYDLDSLVRDEYQSNLYDFFNPTFLMNSGFQLNIYNVLPEEEMRIDIICNNIYKNIDNIDVLLSINDIDNPLNIMAGDVLYYPDYSIINQYRINLSDNITARNQLINSNKSTRIDSNRKTYIEQNYSLPPTVLETPDKAVKIQNNQIILGG